jgi:DNA-binding MarR family transcriptional regulator
MAPPSQSNSPQREELRRQFFHHLSRLSTWPVVFHGAVAVKLGINATDFKCNGVLQETGPITAGELAELTGLTTGAITGVVDRLERAGFVRRGSDPNDRRRVIVEPVENPARGEELAQIFGPLAASTAAEFIDRYSDEELAFLIDFFDRAADCSIAEWQACIGHG